MSGKRFALERVRGTPVDDAELLADLKRVALILGRERVPQKTYRELGRYDDTTLSRRFGSWNAAVRAANLKIGNVVGYSDERLFENLLTLWQHLGRQPRRRDLASPPSKISQTPYSRRFGSWTAALESFVHYANAADPEGDKAARRIGVPAPRRTGRDPSLRMRFKVLKRDNFRCRKCGSSPAKKAGIELHVDHVVPWSRGGETVLENLETLCSRCNLGKSNLR